MTDVQPPAKNPCGSCPYRKDVEPGIWAESEYEKLPGFDNPSESYTVFLCHQQNGKFCAGWVGVHDMDNMLGLRLAAALGMVTPETFETVLDYTTEVPLHASGQAAADHGRSGIPEPSQKARKTIHKLLDQQVARPRIIDTPTEEDS